MFVLIIYISILILYYIYAYVPVAKPDTSHAGSPIPWTRIADSSSGDLAVVRATARYIAEAPDGL